MRWWVGAIAFCASCTGRPFVDVDDGGETSGFVDPDTADGAASEGIVSISITADDGVDDADDERGGDTGGETECRDHAAPPILVDVYPAEDPVAAEGGTVAKEWDCEIGVRLEGGGDVKLALACEIEPEQSATVYLTVDADGITVPADLVSPAQVRLRVFTFRDAELVEAFPWVRSDHFAMYRDGVLVLGAGAGGWWPTTDGGADFWAPLHVETTSSSCDAVVSECHEVTPGSLLVALGEEKLVAPAYSVVSIGGYDVHVGEMVITDSPKCDEPTYGWSSFAIAPTP